MKFSHYQLFDATSITTAPGSSFGNTTITFSNQVTGGALLNANVGNWVFTSANDSFTVAPDNGALKQNIDIASGGDDTLTFGTGTFSGTYTGDSFTDTIRFVGDADISGAVGLGAIGNVDFSDANVSVTVNFLNQYQFFTLAGPFANTANVQTITFSLSTFTVPTGDAGIENYVFSGADDQFIAAADNDELVGGAQNTDFSSGGSDLIAYYDGKYSGDVVGMDTGDRVVFASGAVDITGVNGGAATGATIALFNISDVTATMTLAQHNGFTQPFGLTSFDTTQTIVLTTSDVAIGDVGIENYVLASDDDTFTVAADNSDLVGGAQNVDVGSGGDDILVFGTGTFTGTYNGLAAGDTLKFTGDADISGATSPTGADEADFNDADISVTMTFAQHNGFAQPFTQTAGTQTIWLFDSGVATGSAGIDHYFLNANGVAANDVFTIAKDDGIFEQSVGFGGGDDIAVFGTGTFTGNMTGVSLGDTTKFVGDADIKGVNVGFSIMDKVDFNDQNVSVTMSLKQHNGFTKPFAGTTGTQTITLSASGTATGDGGIENYVLASGDDTFKVAPDSGAFKQNVDIGKGGKDVIQYGSPFSGSLTGAEADDTAQFLPGGGDIDISEVNGGAATGAGKASFSDAAITVSMTLEQYNGFGTFIDTDGTQTIVLTTAGIVTGDIAIESYVVVGEGDYTFALARDDAELDGGSQSLDLVDLDVFMDTVVLGAGTFSGVLANAGSGDRVLFSGGVTDISGLNGGKATGAELLGFSGVAVSATMTLAQHNGFAKPFGQTGGTQTITLATNGTATGDIGIEQYVLGDATATTNVFTVGSLGQNVTGRSADDTVIYAAGGPSGILLGGGNSPAGDWLILQAPNTVLAAGSGEFERLTLAVFGANLTSDVFAHNGFTGVVDTLGTNAYTVDDDAGGTLTGLAGFESYTFVSTATGFDFELTDDQTGTITGSARDDTFHVTADQLRSMALIHGGGEDVIDRMFISGDSAGLDLGTKTAGIEVYWLLAGSTGTSPAPMATTSGCSRSAVPSSRWAA